MKDLNLEVPMNDTRAFTEESYQDLMNQIEDRIVFFMGSQEGDEGYVIKNSADDYLVWFVGTTYKNVGEDRVIDQFYVTCVDAYYTPHDALSGMCLQMKIETESLQEKASKERYPETDNDGIPL